jgi:hypothetical protein
MVVMRCSNSLTFVLVQKEKPHYTALFLIPLDACRLSPDLNMRKME